MLEALGQNSQRQCLCTSDRFIASLPVGEHTWKVANFANPAAVLFLFKFDCQLYSTGSHRSQSNKKVVYLPNGVRLSCGALLWFSQMALYH